MDFLKMKVRLCLRIKHTSTVKAGFIEFIESAYQFTKMSFKYLEINFMNLFCSGLISVHFIVHCLS